MYVSHVCVCVCLSVCLYVFTSPYALAFSHRRLADLTLPWWVLLVLLWPALEVMEVLIPY